MNYPNSISPYIQNAMAQAMQAVVSGGPLPPNCFVSAMPMQQAQQMFPQIMMNYAPGAAAMTFPQQQSSYYGQQYQPQTGFYPNNQPSNGLVPYTNYHSQGSQPNYNYPVGRYQNPNSNSKKKNRRGKTNPNQPHSNVYNSSSFDSNMRNLSWSRLFGTHHRRRPSKRQNSYQAALSYDQKNRQRGQSSDSFTSSSTTSSSSETSDESIRRVNVSTKQQQPKEPVSSSKQPTKGRLPFKYSSEFVPGTEKQQASSKKSNKKEGKVKDDDVFFVKKSQPSSTSKQ